MCKSKTLISQSATIHSLSIPAKNVLGNAVFELIGNLGAQTGIMCNVNRLKQPFSDCGIESFQWHVSSSSGTHKNNCRHSVHLF